MRRERLASALAFGAAAGLAARRLRRPSPPPAAEFHGSELVSREQGSLPTSIRPLLRDLFTKDPYLEGHCHRVALLATQMAEQLGLSPTRIATLATAGLLHDIGKLSVPEPILAKPGPLDEEEFEVVRLHPVTGEQLLAEHGVDPAVRRLVLDHHERLDGSGYPRGTSGEELDLDSRILAACDVYDALISARVYRPAWTPEQALRLLEEEAYEEVLDSRCVAALERVLEREYGLSLPVPV